MGVEKRERGELKNKMVVGGVLSDPSKDSDNPSYISMASGRDDWEIVYYVLDLITGEVSSLPSTVVRYGCMPSIATVGSQLFLFGGGNSVSAVSGGGGDDDDSTKPKPKPKNKKKKKKKGLGLGSYSSHKLDLTKPENGWRLAAPAPGVDDQLWPMGVLEFGGKFYVFDDSEVESESGSDGFICEVFNPDHNNNNNKWRRLKSPPFPPPSAGGNEAEDDPLRTLVTLPAMADSKNNRIIVYFQNMSTMYAYYPTDDRWGCVDEDFNGWFRGGEPVTLADDGVVYIYTRRRKEYFRAYHTVTKQWLNVRLSPVAEAEAKGDRQSYLYYSEYRTLLHRGNGLLCLITSAEGTPTLVHIVQFKVELVNKDKEVLVTPFSSQYFHLHSCCSPFLYLPVV